MTHTDDLGPALRELPGETPTLAPLGAAVRRRARTRRLGVLAAAAAGLVLIAVAVPVAAHRLGQDTETVGIDPAGPTPSTGTARPWLTPQPGRPAAQAAGAAILDAQPLPDGATLHTGPPSADLDGGWTSRETDRSVSAVRYWDAPQDPATVLAFLQANLPAGFVLDGGSTGGQLDVVRVTSLLAEPSVQTEWMPWLNLSVASGESGGSQIAGQAELLAVGVPDVSPDQGGASPLDLVMRQPGDVLSDPVDAGGITLLPPGEETVPVTRERALEIFDAQPVVGADPTYIKLARVATSGPGAGGGPSPAPGYLAWVVVQPNLRMPGTGPARIPGAADPRADVYDHVVIIDAAQGQVLSDRLI